MPVIPIGTDIRLRRIPVGNWVLIGINVFVFIVTQNVPDQILDRFALQAAVPSLHQYLTYQFLHADLWHLLGNMLFLALFGGAVCDRFGTLSYILFYLAGGVLSGFMYAIGNDNPLVGASGAIAAVTTVFLVLFPRVHVRLLVWFFVITTFELPAMILIIFKIILWDNLVAPWLQQEGISSVAYSAHLGGYGFGFVIAILLLALRVLPRNQFDLLALWSRWRRRTGLVSAGGVDPSYVERRDRSAPAAAPTLDPPDLSPVEQLREDILDRISEHDLAEAATLHRRLLELDAAQVLPQPQQLALANHLSQKQHYVEAVVTYEAFLRAYPTAADAAQVRLLAGLLCRRHLHQESRAADHLRAALADLTRPEQRSLAETELQAAEGDNPADTDPPAAS